jgi:hypothetical protein
MISTWIPGQEATISLSWTTMEFSVDINPDKTASSIEFLMQGGDTGQGILYVDECSVAAESAFSEDERSITYVTKLDHTDELPESIQHHLLTDPYLHGDKGTVKVDAADTVSDYLGVKLVAGSNVTITEVAGSSGQALSIASSGGAGGLTKNEITTSQTAAVNNLYCTNNVSPITLTLPATAVFGDEIAICGKGAGGWKLQAQAGQTIHSAHGATVVAGYVQSGVYLSGITVMCITANTDWKIIWSDGTFLMEV